MKGSLQVDKFLTSLSIDTIQYHNCGEPHTMAHLLSCRLLDEACRLTTSGHSDRAGKGMRPQVGEHCVKDTKAEEYHKERDT